jgi:hypothetical protein
MSTTPINGVAGGVPFLGLPPAAEVDRPPLVVAWHLMDPPRTEVAMAAALPLRGLAAWRVYLGLPMHGRRVLPGGAEEFVQRMGADAVRNVYGPVVEQAAAEFPAALAELGDRLPVATDRWACSAGRWARASRSWSWPTATWRCKQQRWSARWSSSGGWWRPARSSASRTSGHPRRR